MLNLTENKYKLNHIGIKKLKFVFNNKESGKLIPSVKLS